MAQNLLYYTVNISTLGGAAPADGFIDNNTSEFYIQPGSGSTTDEGTGWPSSLEDAQQKTRANLRWAAILQQLSSAVNTYSVGDIATTGASATAAGTAMTFSVAYDRPDYLYAYDELNPGAILYNDVAIKRWVARALIETINTNAFVMDPTAYTAPNYYYGPSYQAITAGPLAANIGAAEAAITVTLNASTGSGTPVYPL
jgi:hypothetical protein